MAKNGASPTTVRLETTANIVTHGLNSSFIRKSINPPNVMTFSNKDIVRGQFSAHLLMFNVSFCSCESSFVNFGILPAYGVGDELLNPDAPQALLSEIISNALPQPMMKDGKMNDLSVSISETFLN